MIITDILVLLGKSRIAVMNKRSALKMTKKIETTSNYVEKDDTLYKIVNYESKDGNMTYYSYYVEKYKKVDK
jgi:hypothetical protein